MTVVFILVALLILLMLRVPVAFAILVPCLGYIAVDDSITFGIALQRLTGTLNSFPLLAVPIFILVGFIANESGMADRLINACQAVFGRVRGSLGYVNVSSSLAFSTMSGSATADTAAMGSIMVPAMRRRGYRAGFAAGLTGASSMIGPIMPPSIGAILYAVLSGSSVAGMFLAGVIPAFILFLGLCLYVFVHTARNPETSQEHIPGRDRAVMVMRALPVLATPIIILGGILAGVFTATEAASIAAVYLIVLGLGTRWMSLGGLSRAIVNSVATTGRVMLIATAGGLLAYIMAREGTSRDVADAMLAITDNPLVVLLLLNIGLLVLGTFLEPTSALLISVPVLLPIVTEFGVDPLHFGVMVILNLSIGLLTPPVGLVLFVLAEVGKVSMREVVMGTLPALGVLVSVLLVVTYVPQVSMFLPNFFGLR